ncbi:AAA family ATPase [Shewanella vaxholmensis]|uniref:AAA family ATPase n=1 Tax=Shewanella vaxholmensis TaxID=3063535 RepID=UPI002891BA52|nr:AAA family ATPase [Shewanella sp. SP1S1-4]MDT3305964.1 AAA family ATPase [Shewanella sp. SP1S1-4]
MDRKEITDVFTPRRGEVNPDMYVHRPKLEKQLLRSFNRFCHTLVYGESGNGKSWLFKKVLEENKIPYVIANGGNSSRLKSITAELYSCLIAPGTIKKLGFTEEKTAELNAVVAKGTLKHNGQYEISQEEPLLTAFRVLGESAKGKRSIIVIDNLEFIFSSKDLMEELANILILLDDQRYAQYEVNFLLVGTPLNVMKYFRETKNIESVSNRLDEVSKISSLDSDQTMELIRRGFKQLSVEIEGRELMYLASHIWSVTLGIAQRVQEFCEFLAYEVEDNSWVYDKELIKQASYNWLLNGLQHSYQAIESHFNSKGTTVARKNQVIYCLSQLKIHQFDTNQIDAAIRKNFPDTIPKTNMGIYRILIELTKGPTPLLCSNSAINKFSVVDPKYIMCARVILQICPVKKNVLRKNFLV